MVCQREEATGCAEYCAATVCDDDNKDGEGATTGRDASIFGSCFSVECRAVKRTAWMCGQLHRTGTRDLISIGKVEALCIPPGRRRHWKGEFQPSGLSLRWTRLCCEPKTNRHRLF
jgi:hypothetical protein